MVKKGKNDQRNINITEMFKSGKTLEEVGQFHGLTRERVRQILFKQGVTRDEGGQIVRKKQQIEAFAKEILPCGLTRGELKAIREMGNKLKAAGKSYFRTPLGAFKTQRNNAKLRNIEWELTFKEWWDIWTESNQWNNRGRGATGYCMSRYKDSGPYAVGNVFIQSSVLNVSNTSHKKSMLPVGVQCVGRKSRYIATKMMNKKSTYLGIFDTVEEAKYAYETGTKKLERMSKPL